jgi:hypothetical protein
MSATRKATMRGACQGFIRALEELDVVEDQDLFFILGEEAAKMGYYLEAHQRGIQGTSIIFRKIANNG